MTKIKLLKITNPLLVVIVVAQFVTAMLFTFFSNSISFEQVNAVHRICGYSFFVLAAVHVALNWSWIKSTFLKKKK
jgi:hypothetical protein